MSCRVRLRAYNSWKWNNGSYFSYRKYQDRDRVDKGSSRWIHIRYWFLECTTCDLWTRWTRGAIMPTDKDISKEEVLISIRAQLHRAYKEKKMVNIFASGTYKGVSGFVSGIQHGTLSLSCLTEDGQKYTVTMRIPDIKRVSVFEWCGNVEVVKRNCIGQGRNNWIRQ